MRINTLALIVLLCGVMSAAIAIYSWRKRNQRGALWFSLFMATLTIYVVGYGLELSSLDLNTMLFWSKVEYLGILFFPPFFLIFALRFAQAGEKIESLKLGAIFLIPLLLYLLKLQDDTLHLIYKTVSINYSGPIPLLEFSKGPAYLVMTLFNLIMVTIGNYVLWARRRGGSEIYRKQTEIILSASGLIYLVYLFYLTDYRPFPFLQNIDFNPFIYTGWGLAVALVIFRYRLFDLVPIAREKLIEIISEGVLVFDSHSRLVDANPSANRIFGWTKPPIGIDQEKVFHTWDDSNGLMTTLLNQKPPYQGSCEASYIVDGEQKWYDIDFASLEEGGEIVGGNLVVLHDITDQKAIEIQLREMSLQDELTGLNNRRGFQTLAGQMLEMIYRMNIGAVMAYIDMDDLKTINDNLGHLEGDRAIKIIAKELERICRSSDIIARMGGDEFVILAAGSEKELEQVLIDRLENMLSTLHKDHDFPNLLSFSYGIVSCGPKNRLNIESFLEEADRRMYARKQRNRERRINLDAGKQT